MASNTKQVSKTNKQISESVSTVSEISYVQSVQNSVQGSAGYSNNQIKSFKVFSQNDDAVKFSKNPTNDQIKYMENRSYATKRGKS